MDLRPYQSKCIESVLDARKRGVRRVLYVQATGTGKTVVFCRLADEIVREQRRPALVLAHRDELLTQAAKTVKRDCDGFKVSTEGGVQKAERGSHVIVASVQTIGRKGSNRLEWLEQYGPSLIICDEAHHAAAQGYQNVFERFGAYDGRSFLVGCTATPKRLDRKALTAHNGATFEEQVFEYPLRQGIADGYLCQIRGYRVVSEVNLNSIHSTAGDYNQGELAEAVNVSARTNKAIDHWEEVGENRCTVVFCANVKHAEDVAQAWRDRGYTAECVHGGMRKEDRDAVIGTHGRFITGQTQIVTNCEILTEGFDHPPIDCVMMLRPTKSWGLYMQMVGRGTRIAPEEMDRHIKTDCIIIDVVDNCDRHDIATIPGVLDLPPGLDLQGKSLTEVAEEIEKAGAAASNIEDVQTIAELETRLLEIDFFKRVISPPEVTLSPLNWLSVPGGYYLNCGAKRSVRLSADALGTWHMIATEGTNIYGPHTLSDDLPDALGRVDSKILKVWPDCYVVAARNARWRKGTVTEAQAKILSRKYSQTEIDQMTKGQASAAIDQIMTTWKRHRKS